MSIIDDLRKNACADVDLLRKNDAQGDDFSKPRVVDFLLVADDPGRAELVREFMTEHEFGEATVQSVDADHRVLVRVHMPTTQHLVMCVSGFMECVAHLFSVRYDGWGCVLQRGSV
jgi:hypothetical protein